MFRYCIILFIAFFLYQTESFSQNIGSLLPDNKEEFYGTRNKTTISKDQVQLGLSDQLRSGRHLDVVVYGQLLRLEAIPNDVYSSEKRDDDDILTCDLRVAGQPNIYGAITFGAGRVYVTIYNYGEVVSIYPDFNTPEEYWIEYGIQPEMKRMQQFCTEHPEFTDLNRENTRNHGNVRSKLTMGTTYYEYDVAIACTGEYYQANGNADNNVRTSIINSVNAISAIFKNDLSFTLKTSSSLIKMYNNPGSDPFDPSGDRIQMARDVIGMNFTNNRYDIGHIFHTHQDGDGWANGGLALLSVVCNNNSTPPLKAGGWSGAYSNEGYGWISLAAHEFAHQFSATHTFNGFGGSCTDNISSETAVEIGSGTTVMSYNGLCDADQNVPGSGILDNYFHITSLEQMYNFVYKGNGGSCGNPKPSDNIPPQINANPCNATYKIPLNTPFYLEAKGTFTDDDNHTYCWEQTDEDGSGTKVTQGKVGSRAASDSRAPLFRSYPPTQVPYRYFPALSSLTSGKVNPFDILPSVARTMNFNVSLRDNNTKGGATANDEVTVQVLASGPFVISYPNGGEAIQSGTPVTVKWNTNGSDALCSKVRIKLSFDGGTSYKFTIAENINYSAGSASITIPTSVVASKDARMMIECMDYECFKIFTISKSNFEVITDCIAPATTIAPESHMIFLEGDPGLKLTLTNNIGKKVTSISGAVSNSDRAGNLIYLDNTPPQCAGPVNTNKYDVFPVSVDKSGNYTFKSGGAFGIVMNMYEYEFTGTNCVNHVGSSAIRPSGSGSIDIGGDMHVTLTAGKLYYMTVGSFSLSLPTLPSTYKVTLSNQPSGSSLFDGVYLPSGYEFIYIAVNSTTDKITGVSPEADFTTLRFGEYCIYGVIYKANSNPTSWIGKSISQAIIDGNCLQISTNCKSITINAGCRILSVTPGTQTACVIATNAYSQELIFEYDRAPNTGKINVNGQEFDVTASPQTITLVGLDSDGLPVDVNAYFTELPDCRYEKTGLFTAPVNCCPLKIELGANIEKCVGESVTLDAGSGAKSYLWKRDGVEITGSVGQTITVMTSGNYDVEATHDSGCKQSDKITVTFHELPQVVVLPALHFCTGETFEVAPTITGANKIEWYRNGTLISGETSDKILITDGGTYRIVVYNQYGCKNETSTIINRVDAPVVNLGADQNKCEGEIVILDAGNDGTKYEWYYNNVVISGESNSTLQATKTGNYRVVVTNSSQCSSNSQVKINFFASPNIEQFPGTEINACKGTTVDIKSVITGFTFVKWFKDGVENTSHTGKTEIKVTESGLYTVIAENLAKCTSTKSVQVYFRDLPVVSLGGPNLVSCIGNTVTLNAGQDGKTYDWTRNGTALAQKTSSIDISTEGTYKVVVTNEFGCQAQDQINVSFIPGPAVTISKDASICEGESHTITVTTDAVNPEIKWFDDNGLIQGAASLSLPVTKQGTYRVSIKGGTPACEVIKEVKITVNPIPVVDLGQDISLCEGSTPPVLDAGAGQSSYIWTLDGQQLAATQKVTVAKSGVYNVEVTNAFGCKNSKSVRVTFLPKPQITNLENNYNLCQGKKLNISITSDGTQYEWRKDNIVISGVNGKDIEIVAGGTYEVIVSSGANCVTQKTFVVTEQPSPKVDLGGDFTLCPGESKTIFAGNHASYEWLNSNIGNTATVLVNHETTNNMITNKIYSVIVTDNNGCTAENRVTVTSIPEVIAKISTNQPGVCNGEPVTLTASGGSSYQWTDPLGNSLSSLITSVVVANPTKTTTYSVLVSDNGTCPNNSDVASIEIKIYEAVNVSAGLDTCVVLGKTIKLQATGGVSYQWDHPELIVGKSNIPNPEIKITSETVFTVTVTDINGCTYDASVKVCVREPHSNSDFQLVNIITPNGDGKNDELYFGDLSEYPDNSLKIFNRWGNTIFEAKGYQHLGKLFDGTRRGERLPADTYYYILTLGDQKYRSALTILWD